MTAILSRVRWVNHQLLNCTLQLTLAIQGGCQYGEPPSTSNLSGNAGFHLIDTGQSMVNLSPSRTNHNIFLDTSLSWDNCQPVEVSVSWTTWGFSVKRLKQLWIREFGELIGPWEMWQWVFFFFFFNVSLKLFIQSSSLGTSKKIALSWMPQNLNNEIWFRLWLGTIRQQAVVWANVDQVLCHYMLSLGHIELTHCEAKTKRPAFCWQYFEMDFLVWKLLYFDSNFTLNLFSKIQLTMSQHCFRLWLVTKQMTSHCLNQWWLSLLMHICVTHPQWVNHDLTLSHLH